MSKEKVRLMTISGILIAVVFVFTAFMHLPSYNGYIHVGDAFIYLAACLLPKPYAAVVGAFGAGLADVLGYVVWLPATAIIKAVSVFAFTNNSEKIICRRNILAMLLAGVICIVGYYLYESIIYLNFITPLVGIAGSIIQAIMSSILYVFIGYIFDNLKVKKHIL